MHSLLHTDLAQAVTSSRLDDATSRHVRRANPPPSRLRGHAAHRLATAAARLDRERARRALA